MLVENFIPSLVTISHLEYLSNLSFDLYPMFAQNQAIKAYSQSTNNFSQHSSISSTSDNSVVSDWLPTAASGQGKVPNAPVTTKRYTYGLNSVSRTVEAVNDICFVEKWDISKSCFSELEKSKSSNESSASPDKSPTKCGSKLSLSPSPIRKSHKQTSKTSVSSWEDDELFSFKSSSPKRSASKIHTPPSRVDVDSSSSMDGSIKQVSKSPILEKIPLMTHVQDALPPLRKGIYEAKMKFSGDIEEKRTNNVFGFPIIQRDPKDGWKAKRKFAK